MIARFTTSRDTPLDRFSKVLGQADNPPSPVMTRYHDSHTTHLNNQTTPGQHRYKATLPIETGSRWLLLPIMCANVFSKSGSEKLLFFSASTGVLFLLFSPTHGLCGTYTPIDFPPYSHLHHLCSSRSLASKKNSAPDFEELICMDSSGCQSYADPVVLPDEVRDWHAEEGIGLEPMFLTHKALVLLAILSRRFIGL